jgi:phosphoribosylanthranilate isomerase
MVKICGLTNLHDACEAIEAGAGLLGFIFAKESPRYIDPLKASQIVTEIRKKYGISLKQRTDSVIDKPLNISNAFTTIPKKVSIVGVFTNSTVLEINEIAETVGLDLVQLHITKPKQFQKLLSKPVIQVIGMKKGVDVIQRIKENMGSCSFILLDTETDELVGGTGKIFDWNVVQQLSSLGVKVWMAGGLTADNVSEAIQYHPTVLDVCSGIESTKGIKDIQKMKSLIQNS